MLKLSYLLKSFLHICETALLSNAIIANLNDKKICLSNTFHSITDAHFGNWTMKPRKAPTLLSQQLHSLCQQSIIAIELKIKILLYRSPVFCTKKRPGFDTNTATISRHQVAQLNMIFGLFFFTILCTSFDSIARDSKYLGNLFLYSYFTFQNRSYKGSNCDLLCFYRYFNAEGFFK